jgi:hypothetical protein
MMVFRHSTKLAGALLAGAILAMGGPAFAAKHGHETVTDVIPVAPGAAIPKPAFPLAVEDGATTAAAMAPAATVTPAVQPQHLRASDAVAGFVHQADAALKARHAAEARDRLEQAETALLNARTDGERGYRVQVQDIAAARGALAAGDLGTAQRDVGSLLRMFGHPTA